MNFPSLSRPLDRSAHPCPFADDPAARRDRLPLSWKQRLFVAVLFLIALLISFAAVCTIDPLV